MWCNCRIQVALTWQHRLSITSVSQTHAWGELQKVAAMRWSHGRHVFARRRRPGDGGGGRWNLDCNYLNCIDLC